MDVSKTGRLIAELRREKGFTQKEVAEKLGVCAKTVSKWETGRGFTDVSLIAALSKLFKVDILKLLEGEMPERKREVGNMKKLRFYVCEKCGNIIESVGEAEISCCGRALSPLSANMPDAAHAPRVETVEDDHYITFSHPMEKGHFISFVSYVRFDRKLLVRLYPEGGAEGRIPKMRGGKLFWYCNLHGLFLLTI